jgi:glucose/arabinose dehydrogenase
MRERTIIAAKRVGMLRALVGISALALFVSSASAQLPNITTGYVNIEVQNLATNLNAPLEMAYPNDGSNRLFIVEQGGKVKLYKNATVTVFLDATSGITSGGETGLLGLAFHPGFSNPSSPGFRKFYTYRSRPANSGTPDFPVPGGAGADHHDVIEEWQASAANPDVADTNPATQREVLRGGHPQGNHNGGEISFRPSDGYLYIGFGDGGNGNDVGPGHTANLGNGQDKTNVLGDILRIDPVAPAANTSSTDPPSVNGKYRIPSTNPFIGAIAGADEIFAWGFRNPYRFSFDSVNNHLVVGDVGQNNIEEIDVVDIGKNYGWNKKEGTFLFNSSNGGISTDPSPDPNLINPMAEYDHSQGIAVIGGFVYRGSALPALVGKYVFGDLQGPGTNTGRLFYTDLDLPNGQSKIQEFRLGVPNRALGASIKGWGEDPSGEIYVITDTGGTTGGKVQELVPITPYVALTNLSTRGNVGTGENVLIGGFIINGSAPKKVLFRAIGPSITTNGQPGGPPLPGRLANPFLELHGSDGSLITSNDDWQSAPNKQQISDTGIAPTDSHESAILTDLQPGIYTAIASGVAGGTGIGLIELYDLDQSAPANAVNISTRGNVGTGDNVLIGGFIIDGTQSRNVLIRALGPSLSSAGVSNALQDPTVELHDQQGGLLASNDNWKNPASNQTQVQATGLPPSNDAEAALVASSLAPGHYTAIVAGAGGTGGVALVEVYQLP